ncbi:MAG: hypothetical protein AAGI45_07950 [Cyanobacteria bacterium P01_H01_bin.26]
MSQEFLSLPRLTLPYQAGDEMLVVRDGLTYRGGPHPSLVGHEPTTRSSLEWVVVQIRQTVGQGGGVFHPPNQWIQRPFTFKSTGFGQITALGEVALPPGRYGFQGWSTGMENGRMRARFRSLDARISWPGATTYSLHYSWHIPIQGVFTLSEVTPFVLEMRCDRDRAKPWGFGYGSNLAPELYASLLLFRNSL